MSVISFIALILLVLVAGGFYYGRTRAIQLVQGDTALLHSLPNYHGYYAAIWAGLPAFLLLAAYGLFSGFIVDRLTAIELHTQASGLNARYEQLVENDPEFRELEQNVILLRNRVETISAEIDAARSAAGQTAEQIVLLRQQALDLLNQSTRAEEDLRRYGQQLAAQISQAARAEGTGLVALAGFELEQTPRERRPLFLSDARRLAEGELASRDTPELRATGAVISAYQTNFRNVVAVSALLLGLVGLIRAHLKVGPRFRARNSVERLITTVLFISSGLAVLTTVGIVASLLLESLRFFGEVPLHEFLFGLQWSPQIAIREDQIGQTGVFGAVPLFAGTALITVIAMLVAVPIGLFSAIYLSEYAGSRFRLTAKPVLEILAGIPTVVYGYFALLTVGPALRALFGAIGIEDVDLKSALSAGLVMGVMIIPFISSLSDDVINAVPQSLRDGSYAMGATKSETISKVIMPAALPGIVGAVLLAVSRAIGETMIVVMAAGQAANLTANPLESVTTITVQIVTLLTGDQNFDSAKTLSAFALGLVLFVLTLIMNMMALRVVQRYREKYD